MRGVHGRCRRLNGLGGVLIGLDQASVGQGCAELASAAMVQHELPLPPADWVSDDPMRATRTRA